MNFSNFYNKLPIVFIIFAFGPYVSLSLGVRAEHFVIYPFFLLIVLLTIIKKYLLIKDVFFLFLIWLIATIFFLVRTLFGNLSSVSFMSFIAELESFIQPIAIISIFLLLIVKYTVKESEQRLISACKVLIIMLALNSVWSLINIFVDLSFITYHFWGSVDESVASKAITNGRYSGIFNQPMEAGVMYTLGLFSWLYLSEKINIFKFIYTMMLTLLFIGGFLTVSKVFIFGGIGLFVIGVILNKKVWKLVVSLTFWSLVFGVPIYFYLTKTWNGINYLLRFLNGRNQDFLYMLTAGRFGSEAQQMKLFSGVWNQHPIIGTGFGHNPVYDSAYFYFFANGGIIGLILYLIFLAVLLMLVAKSSLKNKWCSETKFFTFIFILVVGASFGTPILTLNRVSVVLWVFIGLLIQYFYFLKINFYSSKVKLNV